MRRSLTFRWKTYPAMHDPNTAAVRYVERVAQDLRQLGVAVDELSEEDLAILVLSAKGLRVTEIASALSLSRYAIRRRLDHIKRFYMGPPRRCTECRKPLPRDSTSRRRYCTPACSMRAGRRRWAEQRWAERLFRKPEIPPSPISTAVTLGDTRPAATMHHYGRPQAVKQPWIGR